MLLLLLLLLLLLVSLASAAAAAERTCTSLCASYEAHGYIPLGHGVGDEVSATLNYNLADYSMSLAAAALGKDADAARLLNRSKGWRLLFDSNFKGGFMRPRCESGRVHCPP